MTFKISAWFLWTCFLAATTNTQGQRLVRSIACFDRGQIEWPIPVSQSSSVFLSHDEVTKTIEIRALDNPYHVLLALDVEDILDGETYLPVAFSSDSNLVLQPVRSLVDPLLILNVFTGDTMTISFKGIMVKSKHGNGAYLRQDTTWSVIDPSTRSQRVVATGSASGVILRNGDILLRKGKELQLFDYHTSSQRVVVSIPPGFDVSTDNFADIDEEKDLLYVSTTQNKVLVFDLLTGVSSVLATTPAESGGTIDVSESGEYLCMAGGQRVDVFSVVTRRWIFSGLVAGYGRNVRFLGDSSIVLTTDNGLEIVDYRSSRPNRILALPWRFSRLYLSSNGNFVVSDRGQVLNLDRMTVESLDIHEIWPVAGGRQFAGIRYLDRYSRNVILDANTLDIVQEYERVGVNDLLDCDTDAGFTLELTKDTTLLLTNHNARVTREYREPDVLYGRFIVRFATERDEVIVLGEGGGEILSLVTGRPVRHTHFTGARSLYDDLFYLRVRPLSPRISTRGDIITSRTQAQAGILLREDVSVSPVFHDVDEFSFYGFTHDDRPAFLTTGGEYVVRDQNMKVLSRLRLTDDVSRQYWASLSPSSNRLLVSYWVQRIEIYDVSDVVSVETELETRPLSSSMFWPAHTALELPGDVVGIYDPLGRLQTDRFGLNQRGDVTTLSNPSSLRGLFLVAMSGGIVRLVFID